MHDVSGSEWASARAPEREGGGGHAGEERPGVAQSGVGARPEHWQLLHATDEPALRGQAAQFTIADGPSVSAALEMRPVFVPDPRDDWYGDPSLAQGLPYVHHVLALPLHLHLLRTPVGVICLYYTQYTQLTDAHISDAQSATGLALEALLRWRPVHPSTYSRRPVWTTDTRAARWERIHQAAANVAAREGLSLLDVADSVLQSSHIRQETPVVQDPLFRRTAGAVGR